MNKKALTLLMLPLVLSVASCGGKNDGAQSSGDTQSSRDTQPSEGSIPEATIENQNDVDNLKSLLAKQDLSPFNEKTYISQYAQNFSVYTNGNDDEGKYINFFNYRGTGNVGYYYKLDEEKYQEIIKDENSNIFDLMCQGFGYYVLSQYATVNSFLNDESEDIESSERFTFMQQLEAMLDDANLQIKNTYFYADFFDDEKMDYRLFNGAIDKKILFDAITTKALSDLFSRVNVYDGPGYCETIDSLYYQICQSLLESSDKEISDFIINNNITYAETANYLELSFALKEEKYIQHLADNDVIPGIIKGTLYLDKETKILDTFEYKVVYLEEEVDYSTNYVHTATMEFKSEGYSYHGKPDAEMPAADEITVYTDPDEFMKDVIDQVIPPIAL